MNAAKARQLTNEHAHLIEEVATRQMGDIFDRIERAAVAGQDRAVVELPEGFEQASVRVLRTRGFAVQEAGSLNRRVLVSW